MARSILFSILVVLASTAALGVTPYPVVVATHGVLFMGGNRISAPYRLTFTDDHRLTINEFRFPPARSRVPPGWAPTATDTAQHQLVLSAFALSRRLFEQGDSEEVVLSKVYEFVRSSDLVDSARVERHGILIRFPPYRGFLGIPIFRPRPASKLPASLSDSARATIRPADQLEPLRRSLDSGGVVFLLSASETYYVGESVASEVLVSVARVLARQPLSPEEAKLLPTNVQEQIKSPITLEKAH